MIDPFAEIATEIQAPEFKRPYQVAPELVEL
jgi:hypothetical protein